jgi:hypothetical protein
MIDCHHFMYFIGIAAREGSLGQRMLMKQFDGSKLQRTMVICVLQCILVRITHPIVPLQFHIINIIRVVIE